ncbi:MAG: NACHT domain-containing protein [Tepidisphaeraceae bacterium]
MTAQDFITANPVLANLAFGVAGNALTSLLTQGGRLALWPLRSRASRRTANLPAPTASMILQRSTAAAAVKLSPDSPSDYLVDFLASPEVEALMRQVFAATLRPAEKPRHIDEIRREFELLLKLRTPKEKAAEADLSLHLFQLLLDTCDQHLSRAVDAGVLAAHEARDHVRHRMISDQLSSIEGMIERLTQMAPADVRAFEEFEAAYRTQILARHGSIIPQDFYELRKFPLDELYVSPSFIAHGLPKDEAEKQFDLTTFYSGVSRTVVLGNPGGGKSTLAQKLCVDLASKPAARMILNRILTPVLVVLRSYGVAKRERGLSLVDYINDVANSFYQLKPPAGAIEYLLRAGRLLVVLDGLDELLDTAKRQEISQDVETFASRYTTTPLVVTSREVGYDQAPLDPKSFSICYIAPLSPEKTKEYAQKRFATDLDLSPSQRRAKADAFVAESAAIPDLVANPLMLSLLCNIYRGDNYLPRNRPDVYEKCALMLFERWDKSRGLHIPLPFEAHIGPTIKHLALWIYSTEGKDTGVTEQELVSKAAAYLMQNRFENQFEAEHASRQFIETCHGRSWVFTDTGTTKSGERLYQFTHRTFLEYFAAAHLCRTYPTPDRLVPYLLPRIQRQEWDVVALLACQIQGKLVEGAATESVDTLSKSALAAEPAAKFNTLWFVGRSLDFLIPKPSVLRAFVEICVESVVSASPEMRRGHASSLSRRRRTPKPKANAVASPRELFESLMASASENHTSIRAGLFDSLGRRLRETSGPEKEIAFEIARHLVGSASRRLRTVTRDDNQSHGMWDELQDELVKGYANEITELFPLFVRPALEYFWSGRLSILQLIRWHGVQSLFESTPYEVSTAATAPVVHLLASSAIAAPGGPTLALSKDDRLRAMRELMGMWIKNGPRVKRSRNARYYGSFAEVAVRQASSELKQPDSDEAVFTVFLGLAYSAETNRSPEQMLIEYGKRLQSGKLKSLVHFVLGRWNSLDQAATSAELVSNASLGEYLMQWRSGRVSILE